MAADQTAARVATSAALTADTPYVINLTGGWRTVELVNHGADVVYFKVADTEAGVTGGNAIQGGGADDEAPLLGGERLTQNVDKTDCWIAVESTGTPVVSVVGIN